jgi:hypothetical protein
MVGHLRLGEDVELGNGFRIRHEDVARVPARFRVPRGACVGRSDEVYEADRGEDVEGLAVRQEVEVTADDYQVARFADVLDEISDALGLCPPLWSVGLPVPIAQAVQVDDGYGAGCSRLEEPQGASDAWAALVRPHVVMARQASRPTRADSR